MKKICFFNHLHNGDIFNNKAFVEEIMSNIDTTYYYAHSNNPDIIKDLNLEYLPINSTGKFKKSENSDADYSMLMMMIDNEIWFIKDSGTASKDLKTKIVEL